MGDTANAYGLTPQEARVVGLSDETTRSVNKDIELEQAILRRLRSMGAEQVRVNVRFGKAVLNGICDDFGQKRDIYQTVRSMAGEDRVVNHVKVYPGETGRPGRG